MNVVVLSTGYQPFLEYLYEEHPGLEAESYETQLRVREETCFQLSSIFYTRFLNELGHDARTIHVTNERLQKAWLRDHGQEHDGDDKGGIGQWLREARGRITSAIPIQLSAHADSVVGYRRLKPDWFYDALAAQLRTYEPDVVFNKNFAVHPAFFNDVDVKYVVSSIGLPSQLDEQFEGNDGIVSHIPGVEGEIERRGYPSTLIRHGFARAVLEEIPTGERSIPVSFVGSLSSKHDERIRLLEYLAERVPLRVWAPSVDHLDEGSPLRDCYQGEAWGLDMYEVLANSTVTINRHVDGVDVPANVRLFEATGVGTALVTDEKDGLAEIFEPGEEVLTYASFDECVARVKECLADDERRSAVADAGQARTLSEHTYRDRTERFVSFLDDLAIV